MLTSKVIPDIEAYKSLTNLYNSESSREKHETRVRERRSGKKRKLEGREGRRAAKENK